MIFFLRRLPARIKRDRRPFWLPVAFRCVKTSFTNTLENSARRLIADSHHLNTEMPRWRHFDPGVRVASLVPDDIIILPLSHSQRYAIVATPDYFQRHGPPRILPDLPDVKACTGGLNKAYGLRSGDKPTSLIQSSASAPAGIYNGAVASVAARQAASATSPAWVTGPVSSCTLLMNC